MLRHVACVRAVWCSLTAVHWLHSQGGVGAGVGVLTEEEAAQPVAIVVRTWTGTTLTLPTTRGVLVSCACPR